MVMVLKIPISHGIIRAARLGHFPGGPLALGICLKVPKVDRVYVDDEVITVVRSGGPPEKYVIGDHLDGWMQLFNLGDQVPAGILRLGRLVRRNDPEQAAWFDEYDGEPSISVHPWGPVMCG